MHRFLALWRCVTALTIFACIFTVMRYFLDSVPQATALNFFSYFTIQSNAWTAVFLLVLAGISIASQASTLPRWSQELRTMLTLYMSITTSVYWLLLHRGAHLSEPLAYRANMTLHVLALLALAVDMGLERPSSRLRLRRSWLWLLYPLVYGVYTSVRGSLVDWYPYPFTDPRVYSVGTLLGIQLGMGLIFGLLALGMIHVHNRLARDAAITPP